jgi:hypothetical protein
MSGTGICRRGHNGELTARLFGRLIGLLALSIATTFQSWGLREAVTPLFVVMRSIMFPTLKSAFPSIPLS